MSYPSANPASIGERQLREAEEAFRRDCLVPFADRIELLVRAFERMSRPYGIGCAGMGRYFQAQKEEIIRRHAEDHALAHGRLPTGRARLRKGVEVDFDVLAAKVADACAGLLLPTCYRLPRHEREPFFRWRIEALVAAFDDHFLVEYGSDRCNQFWLRSFLRDFVEDYERLPQGKMRIAPDVIPLSYTWYDLGQIDFDALRQATELSSHSG